MGVQDRDWYHEDRNHKARRPQYFAPVSDTSSGGIGSAVFTIVKAVLIVYGLLCMIRDLPNWLRLMH